MSRRPSSASGTVENASRPGVAASCVMNPELKRSIDACVATPERTPRHWLSAASLVLVLIAIAQRPGQIVTLTRLDRILDPLTAIGRGAQIWNPWGDMGFVQWQTTGYLFNFDLPFAAASLLAVPPWLTQRLMMGAIEVAAVWGFVRLVDALGIGKPAFRLVGGLAWSLSPLILSRVGWRTPEALAPALIPWTLVPLVRGADSGSTRLAAARSAMAVALLGGANAAASLAVLPAPLLYLLTRQRGARRASLLRWWTLCVPLAIAWWFTGLVLLSRDGVDLLPISETTDVTTAAATLFNTLRGSADWLATYVPTSSFASGRIVVIGVVALVGMGVAGLSHSRLPERRFLIALFACGLLALGASAGGWLGDPLRGLHMALLEGPARAFRNIYKFQALVSLPVIVGLTHSLSVSAKSLARGWSRHWDRGAVPSAWLLVLVPTAVAVALVASPAWQGALTRPGFRQLPPAWVDARHYLEQRASSGRVLLLPGQPEATYDWGWTSQTPLEWGTHIRWATRHQVPLSGIAAVHVLDEIELAVERGGDPLLPSFLARAGFAYVLAVNDGAWASNGAPDPQRVAAALDRSGLTPVATFGRSSYGNGGLRQLAIYRVGRDQPAQSYAVSSAAWLSGDVEGVLRVPTDLFGDRAYVLSRDRMPGLGFALQNWMITDTNTRVGVNFGALRNNRSYVLGKREAVLNGAPIEGQRYVADGVGEQTVSEREGIERIAASSVGPGTLSPGLPVAQPGNVLDGDPDTSWQPLVDKAERRGKDEWVEVTFTDAQVVQPATIRLKLGEIPAASPVLVTTTTDAGSVTSELRSVESEQKLALAPGRTRRLRVSIDAASAHEGGSVLGIRELGIPESPFPRRLRVPSPLATRFQTATADAPAWVFTRQVASPLPTVSVDSEPAIRRLFDVPRPVTVEVHATAAATRQPEIALPVGTRSTPIVMDCDEGLAVDTSAGRLRFRAETTLGVLRRGVRFPLEPCDSATLDLAEGTAQLTAAPGPWGTAIEQVVLGAPPLLSTDTAPARQLAIAHWGTSSRTVDVAAGQASFVVTDEVANPGWKGDLNGVPVRSLVVDGWRQAFLVPAGEKAQLHLTYTPQRLFLIGTGTGIVLLVCLLLLACWPSRRKVQPAALAPAVWPTWFSWTAAALVAVAVTGIGAVLLVPLWYFGRRSARFGRHALLPLLAAGAYGVAGAAYLLARTRLCQEIGGLINCNVQGAWYAAGASIAAPMAALAVLAVLAAFLIDIDRPARRDVS